jgi:uncharacterized protein (UPF0261 family)
LKDSISMAEKTVAVIGTLDTKEPECAHLQTELGRRGLRTMMIDVSCLEVRDRARVDYQCATVARRAGWDFSEVAQLNKIEAGKVLVAGATAILRELHAAGKIDGMIALGGACGSAMACSIMQAFPIGLPKLVVSVLAAGDPRQNAGTKDIILFNSVTDLCLNRVTRQIMSNAAAAMAGMLEESKTVPDSTGGLQIGATMLGLTQRCVLGVKAHFEAKRDEVLVFHSNGIGGASLEDFIARGMVDAVLDLTTNELGNHLLGGVFDAGPLRLEAAVERAIPHVVAPGCMDFVNFWGQCVPSCFRDRLFLLHSPQNTLMRTTAEENLRFGRLIAKKLNRSKGRTIIVVPLHGFSGNDVPGGPHGVTLDGEPGEQWHNPTAISAFREGLKATVDSVLVEVWEVKAHINDPVFVEAVISAFDACRFSS